MQDFCISWKRKAELINLVFKVRLALLDSWTDSFLIQDYLISCGLLDGGFLNLVTYFIPWSM